MDFRNIKIKDSFGNLLTIGDVVGTPTFGAIQNGIGTNVTNLSIENTFTAVNVNATTIAATTSNFTTTNSVDVIATNVNTTNVNATTVNATDVVTTNVNTTNVNATNVSASSLQSTTISGTTVNVTAVIGSSLFGEGNNVTNINADNISSGTVGSDRISSASVTQHQSNITGTGALNSGSITSGFGDIDVGTNVISGNGFGIIQPLIQLSWNTGYFNLTNSVDNYIPFDSQDHNTATGIFTFVNSGTTNARIQVLETGLYEVYSRVHLFDMYGNIDLLVKLMTSTTSTGTMNLETLLSDKKFAELTADQLMMGYALVDLAANTYINIVVNPSANSPYPSNSDQTPTEIIVKKVG